MEGMVFAVLTAVIGGSRGICRLKTLGRRTDRDGSPPIFAGSCIPPGSAKRPLHWSWIPGDRSDDPPLSSARGAQAAG